MWVMNTSTQTQTAITALDWNDVDLSVWSQDGAWLAFPGTEKDVIIHNVHAGQQHRMEYKRLLGGISISPDSQWALLIDLQRSAHMLNLQTGETRTLDESMSKYFAWSPDGSRLALVLSRGQLRIMEMTTGDTQHIDDVRILLPFHWTQDGCCLIFEHDTDIYRLNLNDNTRHNLTQAYEGKFRSGARRPG